MQTFEYTDILYEKENDYSHSKDFLEGFQSYLKHRKFQSAMNFKLDKMTTSHYVGILKYKNLQIDILPKLLGDKKSQNFDEYKREIIKNLIFMLSLTNNLNIRISESAKLCNCENPFLEVLIGEFARTLFDCLKRYTPKNYIRQEDNLSFPKGKINFSENIKHNFANLAKFYCEYEEFSENNCLNQLFLYVSVCLYKLSKNIETKRILSFIIKFYSDIKFVKFDKFKVRKIKLDRNQTLFEKSFKLAKLFIENMSIDMSGNKIENISLLWDMNKLFEEFIYELLKRINSDNEIVSQQKRSLLRNSKNSSEYGNTFVDVYIKNNTNNEITIIDSKYKTNTGENDDFINSDIYQISTYCLIHNSQNAILFYPAEIDMELNEEYFHFSDKLELNTDVESAKPSEVVIYKVCIDLRKDLRQIFKSENIEKLQRIINSVS